jgi:S1-C subfamily serine protease
MRRLLYHVVAAAVLVAMSLALPSAPAQENDARPYIGLAGETAGAEAVTVREVVPGGPAAQAGIKAGDTITKVDGQKIKGFESLADMVSRHKPGDKLALSVSDGTKEREVTVTLGTRPGPRPFPDVRAFGQPRGGAMLGVQSQPLTPELRQNLGVKAERGALVSEVMPNTPAAKAGLQEKDVITAIDGKPVTGPQDLREAVQSAGVGKEVSLKIERGNETKTVQARLEQAQAGPFNFERQVVPAGNPAEILETPNRVRALEQRVQELEKRLREVEQKQSK